MCAQPRIAFNGLRNSCEIVARNSSFKRFARSASLRANFSLDKQPRSRFDLGLQLSFTRHTFGHVLDDRQRSDYSTFVTDRRNSYRLLHLRVAVFAGDGRHRDQITVQRLR